MSRPRQGCGWSFLPLASRAARPPAPRRLHPIWLVLGGFFCAVAAQAQFSFSDQNSVSSVSGQFLVSSVDDNFPYQRNPNPTGDTNFIQLKTTLLAVSAERFKLSLWRQLELPANSVWSGRIYLRLQPARTLDDTVTITASPFLDRWNYGVELPNPLSKTRYARALSGVLLLEIANRNARRDGHSAEVPSWLVDGMAQQILAADGEKVVLVVPRKKGDELPVNRLSQAERGIDPLAAVRQVLQNVPALTFDQLSWPTDQQMQGADGGVYFACAQLFQSELLALKNGHEKMRALLAELPDHLNWQTAFFHAFDADFKRPLDVEKWWALRIVDFVQRAPGPRWTTDISIVRLQGLLSVPVEFRGQSNALPSHAEISLQAALQNLNPAERETVLRNKERDLALVELRLAPPFGELADAYRLTLASFLGDLKPATQISVANKHGVLVNPRLGSADAIKKLNALDAGRRAAETRVLAVLGGKPADASPPDSAPAQSF